MKFLQVAFLSAIYMECVTASDPSYANYLDLCSAIDEGRLDIAVELGNQNETLGEAGVRYVIRKDNPDPAFIANFVNQTKQANVDTLDQLLAVSPIEIVEKVIEKVDFPQQTLLDFVTSHEVGIFPETFLVLLDKIVKPEDQEKVVENAIGQLVYIPTATSSLLNALKGKTFRSERLEHLAIQKAFREGVEHGRVDNLRGGICNHAAIAPELYADALIVSADWWEYPITRQFLLDQADRHDLEAVKEKAGYADLNAKFRDDIEKALEITTPGGTRTRNYDIQTVEKAEEIFDELGSSGIPKDPFSIVVDFVALDASTRGSSLEIQKAFMEGVEHGRVDNLPEDICNHAAITPGLYADALIVSAGRGKHDPMRIFLLGNADRYDFEAIKKKPGYADLNLQFRGVIEWARITAAPGGARTRAYDIQSAKIARKKFMEIGHAVAIPGITNIIG